MRKKKNRPGGSLRTELRQALQPPAVRIRANPRNDWQQDLERLERALQRYRQIGGPDTEQLMIQQRKRLKEMDDLLQQHMGLVAEICTGVWRIRQNFSQLGESEMPDKVRRSRRHLESIMDSIGNAGFVIKDHLREPYVPGLNLNVVSYEPTVGLERDTVIETIKPSVYWRDQAIQDAEIVVGTPIVADEDPGE